MAARSVLVVDDHLEIREALKLVFESAGYSVETVADGAEALRAVERRRPHLVLFDLHMPVMDGWQLAAALKERDPRLPIVAMSGVLEDRDWADEIGADAFVSKSFELVELIAEVERLIAATPPLTEEGLD